MSKVLSGDFYRDNAGAFGGFAAGCAAMVVAGLIGSTIFSGGISDANNPTPQVYFIE